MINYDGIVYDEERIKEACSLLTEIQKDLNDVDNTLYKGVMKVAYATGFSLVEQDERAIDMKMPEKLMIQCREETSSLSNDLNNQVNLIESFLKEGEEKVSSGTTSGVIEMEAAAGGVSQVLYGPPPSQEEEVVSDVIEEVIEGNQALYAPYPGGNTGSGVIEGVIEGNQALYAPPPGGNTGSGVIEGTIEDIVEGNQLLYGPYPGGNTGSDVIEGTIEDVVEGNQLLYGPYPGGSSGFVQENVEQVLYGPPPSPSTSTPVSPDPQFREDTSKGSEDLDPISNHTSNPSTESESTTITPVDVASAAPQYSAIPETGIAKEFQMVDYAVPAAIGAISGAVGLGVSKGMKKSIDEEDEDEEEEEKDK